MTMFMHFDIAADSSLMFQGKAHVDMKETLQHTFQETYTEKTGAGPLPDLCSFYEVDYECFPNGKCFTFQQMVEPANKSQHHAIERANEPSHFAGLSLSVCMANDGFQNMITMNTVGEMTSKAR